MDTLQANIEFISFYFFYVYLYKQKVHYFSEYNVGYFALNFEHKNKGVSDLKVRLDYCEDPARSCENYNFCFPAQTEPFY